MIVPDIEKEIGLLSYSTSTRGIGGRIKESPEDFQVEEMLKDGTIATPQPTVPTRITGKGKFTTCILVKKNRDSLLTVKEIARRLNIHERRVSIGGIKDTRAVTAQFISIKKVPPSHILRLNIPDVAIYPQSFSKEQINSSLLLGNRFTIMIRGVESEGTVEIAEKVRETFQQIEDHGGVPNFFGHQRFGTLRPISHKVGRLIVKGDFEAATMAFLSKHSEDEQPKTREARQHLAETRDFGKALEEFPKGLVFERIMIEHIIEKGEDFPGALRSLPIKFLRFLVQAYQSYIFNLILSERINRGLPLNSALPGDFVLTLDQQGLSIGEPEKIQKDNSEEFCRKIQEGKVSLVLPVIGYSTILSDGEEGIIERKVMAEEGVQPRCFYIKDMVDISPVGSYRMALVRPMDAQLLEVTSESEGPSAKLAFWLTKGSYATLILREIMKSSDPIAANF